MIEGGPSAIIFDMDGLMLDSEPIYRMAWQQAAGELGYHLDDAYYLRLVGRKNAEAEAEVVATFGPAFPLPAFRAHWTARWEAHVREHGLPAKPGLAELLDQLDTWAMPKAVATSTERTPALRSLGGLARRFDALVTGDEVRAGKPAPDIFLLAAHRLGAEPRRCVVLEDAEAGIRAAHAAGMAPILVPDLQEPSPHVVALACRRCASLHEVRAVLAAWRAQA